MTWVILGGFILIFATLVTIHLSATSRSRRIEPELLAKAEALGASPIAWLPTKPVTYIVMISDEPRFGTPSLMRVDGDLKTPITAAEVVRLFNKGQLRWYGASRVQFGQAPVGAKQLSLLASVDQDACVEADRPMLIIAIVVVAVMVPMIVLAVGAMLFELMSS